MDACENPLFEVPSLPPRLSPARLSHLERAHLERAHTTPCTAHRPHSPPMYAQVLLQPHEQPPPPLGHCATAEEWGRTWPVEGARVWVFDVGGWRPWEQRDFDRYRVFTAAVDKRVWVSTSASPPGNNLPAPAWPADAAAPPPVGAPPGCAGGVPGWLRGWERCGKWRGGPRHHRLTGELVHRGYPTVWGIPPVCPYAYDAFEPAWRILGGAAWETKALDTCASRRVSRRAGAAPHARRLAAHNPPLPLPTGTCSCCARTARTASTSPSSRTSS